MLFANGSLARRIERAECQTAVDMAETVRGRPGFEQALVAPIGGAAAVFGCAGSPFNKLAGLGFAPVDEHALEEVEREFQRRRAPLQVEFASLADNAVGAMIARRGYVLIGFENVLGLRLDAPVLSRFEREQLAAGIDVRPIDAAGLQGWSEVTVTGFLHPDTFDGPAPHETFTREDIERVFASAMEAPHYTRYVASREGELAGAASVRRTEGLAQLCGAATLPAHRRRGVQTALLRARLLDAARAGCDIAVVTTAPGSKSQENVQRQGFELLYSRAIMVRSWDNACPN